MRAFFVSVLCLGLAACSSVNPWSEPPPAAYVVFFTGRSILLSPDAKTIVANAADKARANPSEMVQVAGPSTKVARGYNPRLAQPRIDAVVYELMNDGIDQSRIVQTSLQTAALKTDSSGAERVEIRLVAPPAK